MKNRDENMKEFLPLYWRALGNSCNKTNRMAYEEAEREYEKKGRIRLYSSYESFKSAKSRYENSK